MNVCLAVTTTILLVLVICDVTNSQMRCYRCNTGSDPYQCGRNNFLDISIPKDDGCTCCRTYDSSGLYFRSCVKGSCNGLSGVCFTELCNGDTFVPLRQSAPVSVRSSTPTVAVMLLATTAAMMYVCRRP